MGGNNTIVCCLLQIVCFCRELLVWLVDQQYFYIFSNQNQYNMQESYTMVSLGSLCTGCMLMFQHCYTGGCMKRKTNGTLQFSVIACSIILVPEVVL